jgi:hypothetical protein
LGEFEISTDRSALGPSCVVDVVEDVELVVVVQQDVVVVLDEEVVVDLVLPVEVDEVDVELELVVEPHGPIVSPWDSCWETESGLTVMVTKGFEAEPVRWHIVTLPGVWPLGRTLARLFELAVNATAKPAAASRSPVPTARQARPRCRLTASAAARASSAS